MNANLVVDADADDGGVVAAADGVDVVARRQELEAGDERRVSFLDPLQFLRKKIGFKIMLGEKFLLKLGAAKRSK